MDWGRRKAGEAGLTEGERGASKMGGGWVEGGRTLPDVAKSKNKDKRMPIGYDNIGVTWDPRRDPSWLSWSRNPVNPFPAKYFLKKCF